MVRKPLGTYWFCQECEYIFREPSERPSVIEEKARYDEHNNVDTPGYRALYAGLLQAMTDLEVQGKGLDFGCGPTAFLSKLIGEQGILDVTNYDPFFRNDVAVLEQSYDFITSTEVFEHLHKPLETFYQLIGMLKPGGFLFLLTSAPPKDLHEFNGWAYRRDQTHVGFYSRKTFELMNSEKIQLVHAESPLWIFKAR